MNAGTDLFTRCEASVPRPVHGIAAIAGAATDKWFTKGEHHMKGTLLTIGLVALLGMGSAYAAGDAAAGKAKAATCAGCHGPNGEGVGTNPKLAGMEEAKFIQAMADYKAGKRANAVMKSMATPLSEQDTANLAAYYASVK